METDWEQLRLRYVTGDISYRRLAREQGLTVSAVKTRGAREHWVEQRAQYVRQLQQKPGGEVADRTGRFLDVTDRLLEKVALLTEREEVIPAATLKTLSDVMKNIKEVQMIRSPRELLEQDARIEKLRRDLGAQETGKQTVTVRLEGVEEFAD